MNSPATTGWGAKFRNAWRGVLAGVRSENSFAVHLPAAAAVAALAAWRGFDPLRWSVLILCIAIVLGGELFNTSIERLAKAVDSEENPHLRDALDIASGAVLTLALAAALVGAIVFGTS